MSYLRPANASDNHTEGERIADALIGLEDAVKEEISFSLVHFRGHNETPTGLASIIYEANAAQCRPHPFTKFRHAAVAPFEYRPAVKRR